MIPHMVTLLVRTPTRRGTPDGRLGDRQATLQVDRRDADGPSPRLTGRLASRPFRTARDHEAGTGARSRRSPRRDDRGQPVGGDGLGRVRGRRLDHHPHQRLGPARPHQHPARRRRARASTAATRRRRAARATSGIGRRDRGRCAAPAAGASSPRRPGRRAAGPTGATRSASCTPVSRPSPVVARSRKMTWPDCSPPSDSRRRRAPRARSGRRPRSRPPRCPRAAMPRRNPRLVITVTTTVSSSEQAPGLQVDGARWRSAGRRRRAAPARRRRAPGRRRRRTPARGRRPARHDRAPAGLRGGSSRSPSLMLRAVGLVVRAPSTSAPSRAKHVGRRRRGRAVGAVEHHAQAAERTALERADDRGRS